MFPVFVPELGLGPVLSCLPSHITPAATADATGASIRLAEAARLQRPGNSFLKISQF